MKSEQVFVLLIVVAMAAIFLSSTNRNHIKRAILARLNIHSRFKQRQPQVPAQPATAREPKVMTAEESEAELERLQKLIEDRKRVAWSTDIAFHLWGLYKDLFSYASPHPLDISIPYSKWHDVRIKRVSAEDGLNTLQFELKGIRYKFVDNEEKQGWRELTKVFSLFLYDDSDRCLIEIPMILKVDGSGRNYSIGSGGPNAFLLGRWMHDFISVKLKNQRLRNQQLRAQQHQERLREIEDLKGRFGIPD